MTKGFGGFKLTDDSGISVPRGFFEDVLPQITDPAELQVMLAVFRLVNDAGGLDRPIPERALLRDRFLRTALRVDGNPNEPDRRIMLGIDLSVGRSTLLKIVTGTDPDQRVWYYVNTAENQSGVAAMSRGAVAPPPDLWHDGNIPAVQAERPTVFRLYEQNIGLLTPLIADRLVDALETYPPDWIEDAISEAVSYNRRSWRYVNRILENWAVTGRGDATPEASTDATHRRSSSKNLDPDQYKDGRYLDRTRRR